MAGFFSGQAPDVCVWKERDLQTQTGGGENEGGALPAQLVRGLVRGLNKSPIVQQPEHVAWKELQRCLSNEGVNE